MSTLKTVALASALLMGAASFAMAQAPAPGSSNTGTNAASSGGSGTHATAPRTGSAGSDQKVLKNKNGYNGQQ